jgi:hypothetical protein
MLTHHRPTNLKQQSDHDLTELSWLTQSDIFDRSSSTRLSRQVPILSKSLPLYITDKHRHRSSPPSLIDSSDSEHDNDSQQQQLILFHHHIQLYVFGFYLLLKIRNLVL